MREEGCLTTAGRTLYPPLPSHSTGSSTLHGAKMQRLQQPLADFLNELPSAPGGPGPASGGRGSAAPRNAGGRQRQAWIGDSDEPATADAVRRMARAGRQALRTRPQSRPLSAEPTILSNRLRASANLKRRGRPGPGGRNTGQRSTWIAPRWSTPGPGASHMRGALCLSSARLMPVVSCCGRCVRSRCPAVSVTFGLLYWENGVRRSLACSMAGHRSCGVGWVGAGRTVSARAG